MHELAITQGIIELCIEHAMGRRITSVDIEIGRLGSVVPESIEFCFEACTKDTVMEGAVLNIHLISGVGRCLDCGGETQLQELYAACDLCGSNRVTVESGEEMRVREIEVEE